MGTIESPTLANLLVSSRWGGGVGGLCACTAKYVADQSSGIFKSGDAREVAVQTIVVQM